MVNRHNTIRKLVFNCGIWQSGQLSSALLGLTQLESLAMGTPNLSREDVAVFASLTTLQQLSLVGAEIGGGGNMVRIAIGIRRTAAYCVEERLISDAHPSFPG